MVLVTGNWKLWLVAMPASLAIFAVLFFTVIKPSSDTANQAVKSGLQQSQQVLNQAQKQITSVGGAGNSVTKQAKQQLSKASKLTSCVAAVGTDPSKVEACQSKYAGS
ncbi:MAG TPA: hypothetical protein VHW04_19210 [Solirubrobacteraceae bacterium]|nr:hypothetical protein [Solirubrobacteraceae bacterium]